MALRSARFLLLDEEAGGLLQDPGDVETGREDLTSQRDLRDWRGNTDLVCQVRLLTDHG